MASTTQNIQTIAHGLPTRPISPPDMLLSERALEAYANWHDVRGSERNATAKAACYVNTVFRNTIDLYSATSTFRGAIFTSHEACTNAQLIGLEVYVDVDEHASAAFRATHAVLSKCESAVMVNLEIWCESWEVAIEMAKWLAERVEEGTLGRSGVQISVAGMHDQEVAPHEDEAMGDEFVEA